MIDNIILRSDSYKMCHWKQYPPKTQKVYSYFESRGGRFKHTLFFGLQAILKKYLEGQVVTKEKIDEAEIIAKGHFGNNSYFNRVGWEYILEKHEGRLPVVIKAVEEGTIVPVRNALITIENTDPNCYWLTNYLETLLVQVWYPITVATQSWYMKQKILDYLELTGDPSLIDFKLHDFGFRGVSSVETAGMGGMAHLVNFKGTDTLEGIMYAIKYYGGIICGHSIPASEHSTITSWGRDNESKAYKNMLTQYPTGLVACVSDSFDIYNACEKIWGEELRMEVNKREGTLVIRPDSGDPKKVVPKVLDILGQQFGFTVNHKGFKVLNPKVRVIQGDGISYDTFEGIMQSIIDKKWSMDNLAFGSGGGLLQKLDRDTCKFAFKCSSITVDGKEQDVFKQPITDMGKSSKAGRLALIRYGNASGLYPDKKYTFRTESEGYAARSADNFLSKVFENGSVLTHYNMQSVSKRAKITGDAVVAFEGL